MASPLFIVDEATLKSKLRLSALPTTALDAEAIIDEAILRARVRFYRELGDVRVAALVAVAFDEVGTTIASMERALANTLEVQMVYCELLRLLPNTFMDASGDVDERWNTEAPTRERGGLELNDELARCEVAIVAGLLALKSSDIEECDAMQVFDGTPVCPSPRIGRTLKGGQRRSSQD